MDILKKIFSLPKKFYIFPYSIFTCFIISLVGVFVAKNYFNINSKYYWIVFLFILLICLTFFFFFDFGVLLHSKKVKQVYFVLVPIEQEDLDKYVNDIDRHFLDINNSEIIFHIPSYCRRASFYSLYNLARKCNIKAENIIRLCSIFIKADIFVLGSIVDRMNKGINTHVFEFNIYYKISKKSENLNNFLIANISKIYQKRITIEQNNELEGVDNLNIYLKDLTTFIIGCSLFSRSQIVEACNTHNKLYMETTDFKIKEATKDVLYEEAYILYNSRCYEKRLDLAEEYFKMICRLDSKNAYSIKTQFRMLLTKSKEELIDTAIAILKSKVLRKNKSNLSDMCSLAYLALITEDYKTATKYYDMVFQGDEKLSIDIISSLKMYCFIAKDKAFESDYAYYLLGLISYYCDKNRHNAIEYFNEVSNSNQFFVKEKNKYLEAQS